MGYIHEKNLSDYAFVNTDAIKGPIRGVVMNCHGLDDGTTYTVSPRPGKELGACGVLYVYPYYSPWAWCGDGAIAYMDEVLDTVWAMFDLPTELPFVVTGGSMGGLTSMIYSLYGARKPLAIGCNCPVCDLEREIKDGGGYLARSVYSAYVGKGKDVAEEIRRHSPICMAGALPDVPYLIVSGSEDPCVTEEGQIGPFRDAMRAAGKRAVFLCVPGMGHCNISDFEEAYQTYLRFCLRNLGITEV